MRNSTKGMIVIALHPEVGGFNATLGLARELSESGYRVVYFGESSFELYVIKHGFEYKVLEVDEIFYEKLEEKQRKKMESRKKRSQLGKLSQKIRQQTEIEAELTEYKIEQTEKWITIANPDLLLLDQYVWWQALPFLKQKVPIIGLNTSLASVYNSVIPPVFSGIVPKHRKSWLTSMRIRLAWLKLIAKGIYYYEIQKYLKLRFAFGFSKIPIHSPKDCIKKHGGQLRRSEIEYHLEVPELIFCPQEFDFPFKPENKNRCYIGASVESQRKDGEFNWEEIDKEKPLVYCTLGSHSLWWDREDRRRFYSSVIEVIRFRPDLQLVIQMPDTEVYKFKPFPDNVFAASWVPHMILFPQTSLIICHSGLGTIREALYFAVPLIVFPCGVDQHGNAARVVFHHLGLKGNIKKTTPRIVGGLIDRVFNDSIFHNSVKQMQQIFREQADCKKGIDFIERFLSGLGMHEVDCSGFEFDFG